MTNIYDEVYYGEIIDSENMDYEEVNNTECDDDLGYVEEDLNEAYTQKYAQIISKIEAGNKNLTETEIKKLAGETFRNLSFEDEAILIEKAVVKSSEKKEKKQKNMNGNADKKYSLRCSYNQLYPRPIYSDDEYYYSSEANNHWEYFLEKYGKHDLLEYITLYKNAPDGSKLKSYYYECAFVNSIGLAVNKVTKHYGSYFRDKEDLVQECAKGIKKAIDNFDLTKKIQPSTYMDFYIIHEIQTYIDKQYDHWSSHYSRNYREIRKCEKEFKDNNINNITDSMIAEKTGISIQTVNTIRQIKYLTSVKNEGKREVDGTTVWDEKTLCHEDNLDYDGSPGTVLENKDLMDKLSKALSTLNDEERAIVIDKYFYKKKDDEIAKAYGYTKKDINNILSSSLYHLRGDKNLRTAYGLKYFEPEELGIMYYEPANIVKAEFNFEDAEEIFFECPEFIA